MWYNSKTSELQSVAPWGNSWLHPNVINDSYPDWTQVPDSFVPPVTAQTKEAALNALDAEYEPQFQELQLAWAAASMSDNTTLATSIKSDYATLKTEYTNKREAINLG